MKFLIQTYDGVVEHDFSLTLIEAIKYQNWISNTNDYSYVLTDDLMTPGFIPIGSVEFVQEYLIINYNIDVEPKNIPEELFHFCSRKIKNGTDLDITEMSFVKSNDKIKDFVAFTKTAPPGNYQISEMIEIESEWRCFVYNNTLVGLQNYTGDFKMFPDIEYINNIIENYESAPVAYTLDIGIKDDGDSTIIEVHDFFSCGFYGFSDLKIIPNMFSRWFNNKVIEETTKKIIIK